MPFPIEWCCSISPHSYYSRHFITNTRHIIANRRQESSWEIKTLISSLRCAFSCDHHFEDAAVLTDQILLERKTGCNSSEHVKLFNQEGQILTISLMSQYATREWIFLSSAPSIQRACNKRKNIGLVSERPWLRSMVEVLSRWSCFFELFSQWLVWVSLNKWADNMKLWAR
jgi:hypothetical protein